MRRAGAAAPGRYCAAICKDDDEEDNDNEEDEDDDEDDDGEDDDEDDDVVVIVVVDVVVVVIVFHARGHRRVCHMAASVVRGKRLVEDSGGCVTCLLRLLGESGC